jgi:hypothetical protein
MSVIVIGNPIRDLLAGLRTVTELRDLDGKLLGHFYPPEPLCPWDPELTAEKLEREHKLGGGKPLSEIIARLTAK